MVSPVNKLVAGEMTQYVPQYVPNICFTNICGPPHALLASGETTGSGTDLVFALIWSFLLSGGWWQTIKRQTHE